MIKVENVDVWGFEHAIRGMRNPKNSWEKSDTIFNPGLDDILGKACPKCPNDDENHSCFLTQDFLFGDKCLYNDIIIGPNDMKLMQTLFKGGTEHRKYLRQIFVSLDITAPLYWWKEFDTYKVGTVSNSCSTMHKITAKKFELDDFSHEHLKFFARNILEATIKELNTCRDYYLGNDDMAVLSALGFECKKDIWWQMIQLLPSSYNQKRTITMNYENVFTILRQRRGHKLDEWNTLCDIFETFPYVKEIGGLSDS